MHLRNEDGRDLVICIDSPSSLMFYHQQLSIVSACKQCPLFASSGVYVCTLYGYEPGSIVNAESSNDKLNSTLNIFS